jgi:hypothetical protein
MAASASLTLSGTISGLPGGSETISLSLTNSSASGAATFTTLASGFNTINVPSGSLWVIIVPPSGNTTSLTLKGITGDTGIVLHPSQPSLIGLAAAQTTIGITAGASMSSPTLFQFV